MTLQPFNYLPADSLQTAEALLREHGERAAVLAGGTDLLGALKDAIHDDPPELLIGLKPVTALRYVKAEPSGVRIGALTTLSEIAKHPAIRQTYPLLAEAAASVASPQIRNVATIAGNLCQEPRCWYYRNPDNTFDCLRKGGRWCDALFAENRYHSIFGGMCVSAAPCVTGCPIHNDIPAYMAELRAGKAGRSGRDPAAHQSAGGYHGPGVRALLRGGMQPVRLRRARVDPRRRAHPRRLMRWNTPTPSTRRPQSNQGRLWRSSARARLG